MPSALSKPGWPLRPAPHGTLEKSALTWMAIAINAKITFGAGRHGHPDEPALLKSALQSEYKSGLLQGDKGLC